MAELDPNIILQTRQVQFANPLELAGNAMQLRNLGIQGQNQQIALEQNQRAEQARTAIAGFYRKNMNPDGSVNHAGMISDLANGGYGDKIPAYQQQVSTAAKDTTAASSADLALHKQRLDLLNNSIYSLVSKPDLSATDVSSALGNLVSQKIIDPATAQQFQQQIPTDPRQLKPFLIRAGLSTMDTAKQIEAQLSTAPKYSAQDTGNAINQGTIDPLTGQRTAGANVAKSATPGEALAAKAAADKLEWEKSGGLNEEAKQLMVERLLQGEPAAKVLGNIGRGVQGANDLRAVQNMLAQTAHDRGIDASGILAATQGVLADNRTATVLGQREGSIAPRAQELANFTQIAKQASAEVPRGAFVPWNKLSQMADTNISNPALAKLKAATVSAINAYSAAVGGGSIHVHDQEVAGQLLSQAQSPEAYNAVLDQFNQEAQGALSSPGQVRAGLGIGTKGNLTGKAPSSAPPVPVKSDADYNALKSGTRFTAPDGSVRVKP